MQAPSDPSIPAAATPGHLPLSISIVCKSNEATIQRTIDSVRPLASEIVAFDSGSTDRTIEMLEAAGARVHRVQWQGYNKTKQLAAMACTQAWVLNIDSDESAEPDLAASIRAAIAADDTATGGYELNRKVFYAGRLLHHAWQPEWRLRLFRRALLDDGRAGWVGQEPHDQVAVTGLRVGRLKGTLRHDTIADMQSFLRGQLRLASISAQTRFDAGRRSGPLDVLTSPAGAFFKQLVVRSAWRDGWRGWAAAGATAAHSLMKHLILQEKSRREGGERHDG